MQAAPKNRCCGGDRLDAIELWQADVPNLRKATLVNPPRERALETHPMVYMSQEGWAMRLVLDSVDLSHPFTAHSTIRLGDQYARQTLARCVQRRGVGVAVGPARCGKSSGRNALRTIRRQMRVVQLPSGRLESRRSLLQAILHGLRRPFREMDEGELRLVLLDCLSRDEDKRRPMLLLVDEADGLALRLLDELRMMTNLSADGQPCARLILLGGRSLRRIDQPETRIVFPADCRPSYLERPAGRRRASASARNCRGVDCTATCPRMRARLEAPQVRLINQPRLRLAPRCAAGNDSIGRETVVEAWAELQQLPATSRAEFQEDRETIIEFGKLDDGQVLIEPGARNEPGGVEVPRPEDDPPTLRVAPDAEDAIRRSGRQLDALSDTLVGLDDDPGDRFEPAGRIIPEVNLVYHDPVDLLNEDFQEEEVIVDRYAGQPAPAAKEQAADRAGSGTPAKRTFNGGTCEAIAIDAGSPELEMHVGRALPKVGSKDFARLFSNLRRTAN